MDSHEHEFTDSKSEFRKPSNDGANRKYRRRSPAGDSSSSDGSPRNRSLRPISYQKDSAKVFDRKRRHEDRKDLGRDHSRSAFDRNSESFNNSDRSSSRSHHKLDDDYDRRYSKSSHRSGRDSRDGHRSDYYRGGKDYPSRTYGDDTDKRYKEKSDRRRPENRDGDIAGRGGRNSNLDSRRDASGYRSKEVSLKDVKEADDEKFVKSETSRQDERGTFKEPSVRGKTADGEPFSSEDKDSLTKKQKMFTDSGGTKADGNSDQGVKDSDIDAAKIAALKAAELVNKNLVGTGFMSTDQKKKLLWGNKKNTTSTSEEPSHRWEMTMFGDRERQEKFNKLMSLRLRWPIVGSEGRHEHGEQSRRREEKRGASGGVGEAIHRWTASKGWSNCWSWPLISSPKVANPFLLFSSLGFFAAATSLLDKLLYFVIIYVWADLFPLIGL